MLGWPWLVMGGTFRWAMEGWRRAAAFHEEAKREIDGLRCDLETLEGIRAGTLVDQSHIEWREDDLTKCLNFPDAKPLMVAFCMHCGQQRQGIAGKYKGDWYFKLCERCGGKVDDDASWDENIRKQWSTLEDVRETIQQVQANLDRARAMT